MTPRERNIMLGVMAAVIFGGGAFAGYTFVLSPLDDASVAIKQLRDEIDGDGSGAADKEGLQAKYDKMLKAKPETAAVKRQSLPPNADIAKTQTEYELLIERLLQQAKIFDVKFPEAKTLDSKPPVTPELAAKKPAYTRLQFKVDLHKVDIWQLSDFLYEFYRLDLLHQITDISIKRTNKATDSRSGLDVSILIEAIVLDGAEVRSPLFPVVLLALTEDSMKSLESDGVPDPIRSKLNALRGKKLPEEDFQKELTRVLRENEVRQYDAAILKSLVPNVTAAGEAVAAVGGLRGLLAVSSNPELTHRVTALATTPVLATKPRDYSLLALGDIFYGILPPDKSPPALSIAKISDVEVKFGEKIPDVKVVLAGDGAETAKITATASGSMLPEGELKIDPKTNAIVFPAASEDASESSTATINVVASAETGKESKTSFRVKYARNRDFVAKDDISGVIKLTMVTGSTSGTVSALIQDYANPFKYIITANAKGTVEVVKLERLSASKWAKEDYNYPAGVLAFSDENSSTKRTFKVVAIEHNAIIVAELGKMEARSDGRVRGGSRQNPPASALKAGAANPLASVTGNPATAVPTSAFSRYRITEQVLNALRKAEVPAAVVAKLNPLKDKDLAYEDLQRELGKLLNAQEQERYRAVVIGYSPILLRWLNGMSLKEIDKSRVQPEEIAKILSNVIQSGPFEMPTSATK